MQVSPDSCCFFSAQFANILDLHSFLNKSYLGFTPRTWTRNIYTSYIFISIQLDVMRRIKKTKMGLREEGSTLVNRGTERRLSNHYWAIGQDHIRKLVIHRVQSSASSFNFQYFLVFWVSFSSCFFLLPVPSIFPPITCFRMQCLCKMWPIQLAFLLYIVHRMSLSSTTLCNTMSFFTWSVQLISIFL
jgi:hypothetical protein